MSWIAGVDGCPGGWFVVLRDTDTGALRGRVACSFNEVLELPEQPEVVGVDIPIGLHDAAVRGGRSCDRAARSLLGWPRRNSVFSPPARPTLRAGSYQDALAVNIASSPHQIGLSRQAYCICPKIAEVDAQMTTAEQDRIREVHPEVCFYLMGNGSPMRHAKRRTKGRGERKAALRAVDFAGVDALLSDHRRPRVNPDDVLDACAACWTAERVLMNTAEHLGDPNDRDSRGLLMAIWA